MSSRKGETASTSRTIRGTRNFTAETAAQAWLAQARRLLAVMDAPVESASIETTPDGPLAVVEVGPGGETATANAVLDWALEAAERVLRGDPPPSDAEVYKAANS